MKAQSKAIKATVAVILASLLLVIIWVAARRFISGQSLVWDFRASRDPSVIGWVPTGPADIGYDLKGNFDFTLIVPGGNTFHQTVWAVGCSRYANISKNGNVSSVYAHFGKDIRVADAVALAQRIILEWNGGVVQPLILGGDPPPEEWLKQVAAGTDTRMSYSIRTGGISVTINMAGQEGRKAGLNRTCNLTLQVGMKP